MHIFKILILALLLPIAVSAAARDRQYYVVDSGYIACDNGKNLYTRALYGTHSLWRLETSDMPIFAAYHKKDNRNIHFSVVARGTELRLDSVQNCRSLYKAGYREYILSDDRWGKRAQLVLRVLPLSNDEGAVWEVEAHNLPSGAVLAAKCCSTVDVKINRSGDLGVDPKNCFAPHPDLLNLQHCLVPVGGKNPPKKYVIYRDRHIESSSGQSLYQEARTQWRQLCERIVVDTPDRDINILGWTLSTAGDAIWDGTSYQHGAVGWRQPLSGWRGAYTGDFLGWHDRARTHFSAYASSQVTDVEPTIPHPSQDPANNLARAQKLWGTQMYSNGYICRNPGRNDQMHHYDMNLCYIDELLWHILWTGDLDYARQMWPVIESSLSWEKRNFDPDDDGLFDAYCCIWASDALYYNSGDVTHSTAYNYRAFSQAARIAAAIGIDPAPYQAEAQEILSAADSVLWLDDLGVWAECRDRMGARMIHDHPALWTIYHAIDSDLGDAMQHYLAADYVTRNIPHIPVVAEGIPSGLATISTTDWMPYSWSINNVAFGEVYHMALAYWLAGLPDEAYTLLMSAVYDGMLLGDSPGNIGQISYYDAARGECYRDFADPIGVLSRALVQGLIGFSPDALEHRVTITPGWPKQWRYAHFDHPDFSVYFDRNDEADTYVIDPKIPGANHVQINLDPLRERVGAVTLNGVPVAWTVDAESVGRPCLRISYDKTSGDADTLRVVWDGSYLAKSPRTIATADQQPQRMVQGDFSWLVPAAPHMPVHSTYSDAQLGLAPITGEYYPADIADAFNADVTDIFRNRYESPRSPYTTLQIPVQGIGEWCHPADTAVIDDAALRAAGGVVNVYGVPFSSPVTGHNIVYTSLFDNYPTSVEIPLHGSAVGIALLLAGSTNHMQAYVNNAKIDVEYTDGSTAQLPLIAPYNWCPIEQDLYTDDFAFSLPNSRPCRYALKLGIDDTCLADRLGINEVYGRRIDGGAATMLTLALDPTKTLKSLTLTTIANDVVVGILAATYVR